MVTEEHQMAERRIGSQIRGSGLVLAVLLLIGAALRLIGKSIQLVPTAAGNLLLDFGEDPITLLSHFVVGVVLSLLMRFGPRRSAALSAVGAGLWGLFLLTGWFSLLSFPFAYFGGLGISWLVNDWFPDSPSWLTGVAAPALVLLVGSRLILVGPVALLLIEEQLRTERYERSKSNVHVPRRCGDQLDWLCAPGVALAVDDAGRVALVLRDGSVGLWERAGKKIWMRESPEVPQGEAVYLEFSPTGDELLFLRRGEVNLLNVSDGHSVQFRLFPDDRTPVAVFSGSGLAILAEKFELLDPASGTVLNSGSPPCLQPWDAAKAVEDRVLWVGCSERVVYWTMGSGSASESNSGPLPKGDLGLGFALASTDSVLVHSQLEDGAAHLLRYHREKLGAFEPLALRGVSPPARPRSLLSLADGRIAWARHRGAVVIDLAYGQIAWKQNSSGIVGALAPDPREAALVWVVTRHPGPRRRSFTARSSECVPSAASSAIGPRSNADKIFSLDFVRAAG